MLGLGSYDYPIVIHTLPPFTSTTSLPYNNPANPSITATAPPIGTCTAAAAPVFWLLKPLAVATVAVELTSVPVAWAVVVVVVPAVAACAEALDRADLTEAIDALLSLFLLVSIATLFLMEHPRCPLSFSPSAFQSFCV